MRKILTAGLAAIAVGAAASTASADPAINLTTGSPTARLMSGVYTPGQPVAMQKTQFFWGGDNYCWYDGGWHGPGWYWCGYAWRRGWGWGGGYGWHNWYRGGWHGDRGGWNGGHGGWHDGGHGGWRGGGHQGRGDGDRHHHH